MRSVIEPQPGILDIRPYQGGKSRLAGRADVLKLSSNENPLGCSDAAKAAFAGAAQGLNRYPGTDHASLRAAIADVHGLDGARIICGAGSDEVLQFVAQSYAGPGDEVIYTEHGFSMYPLLAHAVGATPVKVAERMRVVDVDAILAACTERTRIVFIANPGNPTGTMIPLAEVARLADGLPAGVLLVHDGAYTEYVDGFDGGAALAQTRDNVVMTRTFSKIYGLGGLRIGWGYGPAPIIDVANRIRQPFNLSSAQLVTAEAAVCDTGWVEMCRTENARMRRWLAGELARLGVPSDESRANFILARFGDDDEAARCDAHLREAGILVRSVAGYGLGHCLRMTVGDEAGCRRVLAAIREFKGA